MSRSYDKKILTRPFYLILLPVFFVFHGFTENYETIPAGNAMGLLGIYLVATLIILGITWIFYRNVQKASYFTFLLMCFFFFFGWIHDSLKFIFPGIFLSRYSFILVITLAGFIGLHFFIRPARRTFRKTSTYLNVLFLLLILIDIGALALKTSGKEEEKNIPESMTGCAGCPKPDIYLIIADGYPGKIQLRDLFGFDNGAFENELKKRGFYVTDSSNGNYNFTPFSMAAMMNMDYLRNIEGSNTNPRDMRTCYATIKASRILQFVESLGYEVHNFSIFDLEKKPSVTKPTFLPGKTSPITSQTLFKRLEKDLAHNLVTRLKVGFLQRWLNNRELNNNNKLLSLTERMAAKITDRPRFVYTHIVMPHYPYYFDAAGNKVPDEFLPAENATNPRLFKDYLIYANKRYLALIDHIKASTGGKAIIIFASDHGYRELEKPAERKYYFLNLSSAYFPDGNYEGFYKGMSNVNLFRVMLNSQFNQNLPMLRDSTSFLLE